MKAPTITRRKVSAAIMLATMVLAGCVTVPPDAGFDDVQESISSRVDKQIHWNQSGEAEAEVSERIRGLLADELNVDEAVQIAFLNNPALQATYEDLGIAQAALVQAGLLRNPIFHAQVLYPRGEDETNFDIEIVQSFMSIFTMPLRKRVAKHEFELAKLRVTGAIMDLALDVRKAYFDMQAAAQTEEMMAQVSETTAASVYAAERLHEAGNITDLALANQHAIHQDARLLLATAQADVYTARERLNVLMGLWGQDTGWKIAGRLPDPPAEQLALGDIEKRVVAANLDLEMVRLQIEAAAKRLGLSKSTRLIPEFEAGVVVERDDGEYEDGFIVGFPLPIFDAGQARVAADLSNLRRWRQNYAARAIALRAEARVRRAALDMARARAEHLKGVLLPLSQRMVNETLLEYNAMQVGVFQLLRAQERQIDLGRRYIQTLRDYWTARSELEQLLMGRSVGDLGPAPASAGTAGAAAAEQAGGH